jgi:peptidoglycan/xylan/chitin deacetylase (PgdA/CDA1 family)
MQNCFRRVVKHLLSILVFYSGFLRIFFYFQGKLHLSSNFTILMYHQIIDTNYNKVDSIQPGMVTAKNTFDKQMKFLKKHYKVISLDALVDGIKNKIYFHPRSVVITFDDGWKDNYFLAFPVLKRYGLPATIFLSTDYINTSKVLWFWKVNLTLRRGLLTSENVRAILDSLKEINPQKKKIILDSFASTDKFIGNLKKTEPEFQEKITDLMIKTSKIDPEEIDGRKWILDWTKIKEMSENQISFGSHARSHRILTFLNSTEIREEVVESKKVIEEKVKKPVSSFAYPNGDYAIPIKDAVKEAGYQCACTTDRPGNQPEEIDLFALRRIGIHEGACLGITKKFSKAIFACQIAGLFRKK